MNFDDNFLEEMGLSAMPGKQEFLSYLKKELETRIGERISSGLSEQQLDEFDNITDKAEATTWLENNRPDYQAIVEKTVEEMKNEIRANRERLLA